MNKYIAWISEHQSPLIPLGSIEAGGQVGYVDKVPRELVKLGYTIDIFTRWDDPKMPEIVDCKNGIRVIHVKAGPVARIEKEKLLPFMEEFMQNVSNFIEKQESLYQLIHANFFMSALVALRLKKQFGIPFVVTFHALGKIRREYQGKADGFPDERFAIEEQVVREADYIVAESPQEREDLIIYYHANQDKIFIAPGGFDPHEFYPMDKRLARMHLGLPLEGNVLLQLGRMVPRKGVENVIRGTAALIKREQVPATLVIVGGESERPDPALTPEIGRLQKIVEEEGIKDNVIFVGRRGRDKLVTYYNAADVFVDTPWYETFGVTPLESMACGTPIVASKVGGIQFTVVERKTGFLVPPTDPDALAKKVKELLTDEKLSRAFRENGMQRVSAFFTFSTIARSLSTLYDTVVHERFIKSGAYQVQLQYVEDNFVAVLRAIAKTKNELSIPLLNTVHVLSETLGKGGKVLICGNGGSASESQHFAAELVGSLQVTDRSALPVLSLASDSSILTAVANDSSYEAVFARQVEAFGVSGDVLIVISTSGKSKNILHALKTARVKNMVCIGLLGRDGGEAARFCDIPLVVPEANAQRIQEVQLTVIHTICELVEKQLFGETQMDTGDFFQTLVGMKNGKASYKDDD